MRILIIAATETELMPLLPDSVAGTHTFDTLATGVGLLSSAISLIKKIHTQKPDLAIQTGIAGSLVDTLPIGEAVVDLGVSESGSFASIFKMGLADPDANPFVSGGLTNHHEQLLSLAGLQIVDAVSVNEISTNPTRIQHYHKNLGASIESMEGAAFHQVCLEFSIPFVQIRSISNMAGVRDKSQWNIPLAIASSTLAVKNLISKI
jgi:futalosine hydrolase